MEREKFSSRLGVILISAGCAIGCGNMWKFPWMCGQNGGGSFMLVYIICLIILGIPALTMEISIGRAAQTSPLHMYHKLEKPGQKWGLFGPVCLIGNLALMAFYTGTEIRDKALIGHRDGQEYNIMDDKAVLEFFAANCEKDTQTFVTSFLGNEDFFGQDLNKVPGLTDAVVAYLDDIKANGMRAALCKIS